MKQLMTALMLCVSTLAYAQAQTYGDFNNVEYVRNYDGDTVTFNIHGVHDLLGRNISIRVRGIDTPEIKGKCAKERELALGAKRFVQIVLEQLKPGRITLRNVDRGKYFRIVADIMIGEHTSLGQYMVEKGFAVIYNGGKKVHDWCK